VVLAQFAADYPPGSDQAAPIDYAHADLLRKPTDDLTPASGWIAEVRAAQDGGIEGRIEWTDRARAMIAAREIRYLSPELLVDPATNQIVGLSGGGLTHRPNLYIRALHERRPHSLEPQMEEELAERLRYLFNLPTLATPAEIVAELEKAVLALKAAGGPEAGATMAPQSADAARHLGALRGLCALAPERQAAEVLAAAHQRITAAEAQVADLQGALAEREAQETVAQALRDRLIEPAKREWALGYAKREPQGFCAFLKGCTPVLPAGPASRPTPAATDKPDPHDARAIAVAAQARMRADPQLNAADAVRAVLGAEETA
jgi:phage I-like protein